MFKHALILSFIFMITPASCLRMGSVLVVGANGKTGREVVYQSLKSGKNVVGLVRNNKPILIPPGSAQSDGLSTQVGVEEHFSNVEGSGSLKTVIGSATVLEDVAKCFYLDRVDSVVVALGGNVKDVGKTMLTDATKNILIHMGHNDCEKIIVITSVGTGDSYEQAPLFFKGLMATIYKDMFEDKNNQENVMEKNTITDKWCVVRPGGLTTTKRTDDYAVFEGGIIGQISRADLAKFCLDFASNVNSDFFQKKVSLSNVNTHHLA